MEPIEVSKRTFCAMLFFVSVSREWMSQEAHIKVWPLSLRWKVGVMRACLAQVTALPKRGCFHVAFTHYSATSFIASGIIKHQDNQRPWKENTSECLIKLFTEI